MRLLFVLIIAAAFALPIAAQAGGGGRGGGDLKTSVSPPAATVMGRPCTAGACAGKAPTAGGQPCTSGACARKRTGFGPAGAAHKSTGSDAAKTQ